MATAHRLFNFHQTFVVIQRNPVRLMNHHYSWHENCFFFESEEPTLYGMK